MGPAPIMSTLLIMLIVIVLCYIFRKEVVLWSWEVFDKLLQWIDYFQNASILMRIIYTVLILAIVSFILYSVSYEYDIDFKKILVFVIIISVVAYFFRDDILQWLYSVQSSNPYIVE